MAVLARIGERCYEFQTREDYEKARRLYNTNLVSVEPDPQVAQQKFERLMEYEQLDFDYSL